MTLKMGSRSHNYCQIFAARHLCTFVQDYYKYRNSLTFLGVKIIATNANNNVDVLRQPVVFEHDNIGVHALYRGGKKTHHDFIFIFYQY